MTSYLASDAPAFLRSVGALVVTMRLLSGGGSTVGSPPQAIGLLPDRRNPAL